jgi:hypothetical protein
VGYRAPSFNLDDDHLAILAECGFRYDSSFHPFTLHHRYAHLNNLGVPLRPGIYSFDGRMTELALPVERLGWLQLPISGGGYFRLYPEALFRRLVRRAIARDGHYMMYLHSWEFDPEQPRVKGPRLGYRFRHYNNLSRTLPRMRQLLGMLESMNASFVTVAEFLDGALDAASTARTTAVLETGSPGRVPAEAASNEVALWLGAPGSQVNAPDPAL